MLRLHVATPPAWVECVISDFDQFLLDHASCERKASAMAMSFVAHYPDRSELVDSMIELAQEELAHFAATYRHIAERGLTLRADEKDPYVGALLRLSRNGTEAYFLDRLLLAGIIEARGCERFGLLADALPACALKGFYQDITRSEARHHSLFLRLARTYFAEEEVRARLDELLIREADIVCELPLRAALH